ncbi:Pesticidal crystal cry8Ba protein [Hirschfeldia incana]|nr:Pesticidal crystal cry8Ba protein [Hirschfeldia incana]
MISSERLKSPAPPKVRNGNVTAASAPLPDAAADATASEDDMSVNSDDASLDSSPENSRVSSGGVGRSYGRNSSCYTYSEVSSSRDTALVVAPGGQTEPRYDTDTEEEDESTDSASSSQFSPPPPALRINGGVSRVETRLPITNGGASVEKEVDEKLSSEEVSDIPSAPPFSGAAEESEEIKPVTSSVQFSEAVTEDCVESKRTGHFTRTSAASESFGPSDQHPARLPTFHASARGPWHAVVSYDACVRLCLNAWAKGCMEAPMFLDNECALLREAFGLKQLLLQSEEEMLVKQSSEAPHEGVAPKPKKNIGKMSVQVRRVKASVDAPTGCSISSLKPSLIKFEKIRVHFSSISTRISSGWRALRKIHVRVPANGSSLSRQSMGYVHASTQYLKQVSGLLKVGVTSLRNSSTSYDLVQETYSCRLRLKSLSEDDAITMQPGSGEDHVFFPDSHGDDLIVEILDSNGKEFGRVLVQLAYFSEDSAEKLRWWSVFREPEHQLVGKLQLYINYSASFDDNSHLKCGSVAETVAYDLVLEVALKMQRFQQRNLLLYGSWKWLLEEFASYYGISDVYTKLRYLSYVMDVATPTSDCLHLVHDLLTPVIIMKGNGKSALSHQENRILNEIKDQIEQILKLVFENYKSLDESSFSGMNAVVSSATGVPAPALTPAVKLYMLLHDILSPEDQTNLCQYFQAAAKKRSRRHMGETDEFVSNNSDPNIWDPSAMSAAYQKMTMVCKNVKNEIFTDMEIQNQDILPSFLDLPNLSASIYSTDLCSRLRAFLVACPPSGPSPTVAELVVATADFQRDISSWNISPIQGGVDAKELFHLYIMIWIQDRRLSLLESCKLDKVKWSGVRTQHSTTPFVDEMYTRLNETIQDYQVIISRWPEYIFVLESAIADVEKAIVEALEKQYADVLSPLKENLAPKKLSFKYVQKLTKRNVVAYTVPDELGILLNTMKRMLDIIRPKIEAQFKAWSSCIPDVGNAAPGDRLSEVTVMLRAKFRNYLQAVVEKLVENSKLQKATMLKKILQDSKESVGESDIRSKMQNLKEQLTNTVNHLHSVCETNVFIALSRGYWDRMGQIVLSFLENRKENRAWYKGSRVAVSILDDTFAAQMQQLLGNSLREQDMEPPRSIVEVRSILCKDTAVNKSKSFYY